jgi:predicted metal-dependent hydrolase
MSHLPPFTIQENPKAKRVILKVSPQHGLIVVIPKGFSQKEVPNIIQEKRAWIERAFRKIQQKGHLPVQMRELPTVIHLPAIHADFTIEYAPGPPTSMAIHQISRSRWRLTVNPANPEVCRCLLKHWLKYQGRVHLIPWLKNLSEQTRLPYRQAQIRGQKSLWGSCSGQGNISLNYNLLFLRPQLVRYILLHELCHTVHFNHSQSFYQLLATFIPDHQQLRAEMKQAWGQVPWWAK